MPRSALILSCMIHGSVLALAGWSSLLNAPRLDLSRAGMSVSLSSGESALVSEEFPAPEIAAPPEVDSFTPPAPTIEPPPVPATTVEITPPPIPTIVTTSSMPPAMPSVAPAEKERPPRATSAPGRKMAAAGGASSGMIAAGGGGGSPGYVPPHFLLRYKPPYPEQARTQRLEGVVLLLVGVDAEGRVTSASIRQGSGHAVLDRAALEAVRTWQFTPGRQNGLAIPATVEIPIRFSFSA